MRLRVRGAIRFFYMKLGTLFCGCIDQDVVSQASIVLTGILSLYIVLYSSIRHVYYVAS